MYSFWGHIVWSSHCKKQTNKQGVIVLKSDCTTCIIQKFDFIKGLGLAWIANSKRLAQKFGNKSWFRRCRTKCIITYRARGLLNITRSIFCIFEIWGMFSSPSSLPSSFRLPQTDRAIVKDHPPLVHSTASKLQVRCHECTLLKQESHDSVSTFTWHTLH